MGCVQDTFCTNWDTFYAIITVFATCEQNQLLFVLYGFTPSQLLVLLGRRSSSIDKCPSSSGSYLLFQRREMLRSESLRADPVDRAHRIFRPSDLLHGEVLGKGCFGQAVKVNWTIRLWVCFVFKKN